jgi:Protein of unknown function (DUF3891)
VIVRSEPDRLILITQPDHAHLARRIMERLPALAARPRRDAILHAIGEHDNGWTEEDAAPIVEPATGAIADFVHIAVEVRHRVWPRGIGRLAADPWAAALVAQHAITIYDRFRGDAVWGPFFTEMESLRTRFVAAAGLTLSDLLADYPFVRLGDLISLSFCTGWTSEQRYADWSVHADGSRVIVRSAVAPGLFAHSPVPIEIPAREIHGRAFSSDGDLRAAVDTAPAVTLHGSVVDA